VCDADVGGVPGRYESFERWIKAAPWGAVNCAPSTLGGGGAMRMVSPESGIGPLGAAAQCVWCPRNRGVPGIDPRNPRIALGDQSRRDSRQQSYALEFNDLVQSFYRDHTNNERT
jgi:hypothetical protein